jgi:hypothetical protein
MNFISEKVAVPELFRYVSLHTHVTKFDSCFNKQICPVGLYFPVKCFYLKAQLSVTPPTYLATLQLVALCNDHRRFCWTKMEC